MEPPWSSMEPGGGAALDGVPEIGSSGRGLGRLAGASLDVAAPVQVATAISPAAFLKTDSPRAHRPQIQNLCGCSWGTDPSDVLVNETNEKLPCISDFI